MEKVRIGNDLRVNFSVYRNGEPESFDGATNISTKIVNESYNKTIAHTYAIVDNVIQFNIDALELKQCGKCRVFISYTKVGDYTVDSPAFELVQYTEDTGGTEVIGIEIVKINISGDIGINRDGASAYEVWEAYPGNEGKTIEQYFEWLHENPTKVDTSRTITAGYGLTGGGDLTEDRTINIVNTDDSIVVSDDGIKVDTQDTLTSDSASKPLSAKQGKLLQDNKAEKTRNIVAGAGLIGGGDLTADRTINVVAADDSLDVTADNIKVNTNNTLTSTSTTQPLSANQGKVLNEKVVQVETDLNYMYPSVPTSKRILADSGTIKSRSTLNDLTNKFLDLLPNTKLLFCPHLAVKLRESGIYKYVTKLYDVGPAMLDGAQTTALNQPYLCGSIAPNEKYALKNPNGGSAYLTHTPITFSATDKWSVSTMLSDFCSSLADYGAYCGNGASASNIYLRKTSANRLRFLSNTSIEYLFNTNNSLIGKNSLITFVAFGNGTLNLYLNGKLFQSITSTDTSFIFSRLVNSYSTFGLNGVIQYHSIRDIALSPTQVQEEYTYLRSIFPEIESVQIGTQTWATSNCEMTCTPQGNIIQEMQASTNVEKVTNAADREFSSDTGFWSKTAGITILNSICNIKSVAGEYVALARSNILVIGKYYKLTYAIINSRGGQLETDATVPSINLDSTVGNHTYYIKATDTTFRIKRTSICDIDIDNVSIQEVGWSDSTNLYNDVYANTSGTAEQKEYAAVKASAMWCHFNNDPAIGAVYGKLYSWYAVKLLQMDIDYYNSANPTATWGWRVPTSADFTMLSTYLGGDAVSGGKMKKDGTDYWDTPNTGATNESGLSILGAGYRFSGGEFSGLRSVAYARSQTSTVMELNYNAYKATIHADTLVMGFGLRLIKA